LRTIRAAIYSAYDKWMNRQMDRKTGIVEKQRDGQANRQAGRKKGLTDSECETDRQSG